MSSNPPPVLSKDFCKRCGAPLLNPTQACWLCKEQAGATNSAAVTPDNPYAAAPDLAIFPGTASGGERKGPYSAGEYFLLATLFVCLTLAGLLMIGAALQNPAGLIYLAVLFVPAFGVTIGKGIFQYSKNKRLQPAKLLVNMLFVYLMTMGVLALLFVAALILLFMICTGFFGQTRGPL